MLQPQAAVDPERFREVLGHYPTGVALITAVSEAHGPMGMVVGTFSSVSLDPPLIAFMPRRSSRTFEALRESSSFCVNVLAADQEDLCRHFAGRAQDKFSSVTWTPSSSGAPVIAGVVAVLDCMFESVIEAGDHFIVLGRVGALDVINPVAPLLFFQGGYGRFAPTSLVAYADADVVAGVRVAELARELMEQIATDLDVACTAFAPVGNDLSVVAVAVGRSATPQILLGSRVPLIPPLGEQYVANEASEVAERWLERRASDTRVPDVAARYRARLRVAKERGWSLSMAEDGADGDVFDAVREYSDGEMTPARLAHLREVIRRADELYESPEIVDGLRYDVGTITVPVTSADGHVQLLLRLSQLPSGAPAAAVRGWIRTLKGVASRVSAMAETDQPRARYGAAVEPRVSGTGSPDPM